MGFDCKILLVFAVLAVCQVLPASAHRSGVKFNADLIKRCLEHKTINPKLCSEEYGKYIKYLSVFRPDIGHIPYIEKLQHSRGLLRDESGDESDADRRFPWGVAVGILWKAADMAFSGKITMKDVQDAVKKAVDKIVNLTN